MTFAPIVWPVVVTLFVLWGLGGFLAWAAGLRGFSAVAIAPAFAMTLVAGSAVVASWTRVPWSLLPVAVMTALVGVVLLIVRWRFSPPGLPQAPKRRFDGWLTLGLILAGAAVCFRVLQIVQAPGNISQTFDNIFHLNAVRYVLTEGDASSLRIGYMTSPDGTLPFYPAAWHALVSLVVQLSGATIPIAINAVVMVVAAVVWPFGAVLLARTLFGRSPAITISAALLGGSMAAFPILPMDYGVLYPFQLSLALLPTALAAAARLLRLVPPVTPSGSAWWALILVGIIPGLTLAHPGGFVAWLALTVPMVLVVVIRSLRRARTARQRWIVVVAVILYAAAGAALVRILRPPAEARGWPTQMSLADAAWQSATLSMWYLVPAVVATVCVLAGVVWVLIDRTPRAWVALGMYVIGVGLFVVVAALPLPALRDALTGSWYNNLPRLASILAVSAVPLAAYGAGRCWIAVTRSRPLRRIARSAPALLRTMVGATAACALLVALQVDGSMARAVEWASPLYRLDADSPLLTADEYALLLRVPEEVPQGVAIAGSAWTGASLASAISDRPVLMPHTLMQISREVAAINDGLDEAQQGDAVCHALADLGVGFVLDFGSQEVHPGHHDMPGLDGLADSSAVELVDQQGNAKLYRIVACG